MKMVQNLVGLLTLLCCILLVHTASFNDEKANLMKEVEQLLDTRINNARGNCVITCLEHWRRFDVCVTKEMLCDGSPACYVQNVGDVSEDENPDLCQRYDRCPMQCKIARYANGGKPVWKEGCLQEAQICDQNVDCQDKTDEIKSTCINHNKKPCHFICPGVEFNEMRCVKEKHMCDNINNCPTTEADEDPKNCAKSPNEVRGLSRLLEMILGDAN